MNKSAVPEAFLARPRLLLIDDEPALAEFVAEAATLSGYDAVVTGDDAEFRSEFTTNSPELVALDLGMPGMDGVELLRFLADARFAGPGADHFSGFDRRVLESAFRLGEALGLTMAGPIEKPVRLDDLERLLHPASSR